MGPSLSTLGIAEPKTTQFEASGYSRISQSLSKALVLAADSDASVRRLAVYLAQVAETAFSARYMDLVEQAALMLLNLPVADARTAGAFYHALCLNRAGSVELALSLLTGLADDPSCALRSRAVQALGAVYTQRNRLEEAAWYQIEAAAISRARNPMSTLFAHMHLSAMRSMQGDHAGALADLDRLRPIVTLVGARYPAYFHCFQNERAVELNALGRTEEAKHAVALALASPFAKSYPEWEETRLEIEARAAETREPASSLIAVPELTAPANPSRAKVSAIQTASKTYSTEPPRRALAFCNEPAPAPRSQTSPILGRYITGARTRGPPKIPDKNRLVIFHALRGEK